MVAVTDSALLSDPALAGRARQRSAATELIVTHPKDSSILYIWISTFVAIDATKEILETNANSLATDLAMALEPSYSPNLTRGGYHLRIHRPHVIILTLHRQAQIVVDT